jgi:hypothetical protein
MDLELNSCLAIDVLSIECVDLFSWPDRVHFLLLPPFLVGFDSILESLELPFDTIFGFSFDHQFDGAIDDFRLRKHPLSDIFATVRALLAVDQTLVDANFTERVTADGGATTDDIIHADWTIQLVNSLERLV